MKGWVALSSDSSCSGFCCWQCTGRSFIGLKYPDCIAHILEPLCEETLDHRAPIDCVRIVFMLCLVCLRRSQNNMNKVSKGLYRERWVRSGSGPKRPNTPRTQPLSTGDEATLGSILRKPSKQAYLFLSTIKKTQDHLRRKSLVRTRQGPQPRRKTH
jgi:hypothetical protein